MTEARVSVRGPRVLWLSSEPPDHAGGGGGIRQAHLFTALAARVPVDLVVVGRVVDEIVRAAANSVTELEAPRPWWPAAPGARRLARVVHALASPAPQACVGARPARRMLAREVRRRAAGSDVVLVEHESLAGLLPRRRQGRWLVTFHHLLSAMADQQRGQAHGWRARWWWRSEAAKSRRHERWALRSYDRVIVCSDVDAAHLCRLGRAAGARPAVVPNGVDLNGFAPDPLPQTATMLFCGSLDYWPNVEGLIWFCRHVLPDVRAQLPASRLAVVGHRPGPPVLALAGLGGVSIHADVATVQPHLAAARVVVVPVHVGSGTRLKALEAMAAGRPVVGTSVGLDGLGLVDGVSARIVDDPAAMADALVQVLCDDALAARLATRGRALVEDRFGWGPIGDAFADLVTAAGCRTATPLPG